MALEGVSLFSSATRTTSFAVCDFGASGKSAANSVNQFAIMHGIKNMILQPGYMIHLLGLKTSVLVRMYDSGSSPALPSSCCFHSARLPHLPCETGFASVRDMFASLSAASDAIHESFAGKGSLCEESGRWGIQQSAERTKWC